MKAVRRLFSNDKTRQVERGSSQHKTSSLIDDDIIPRDPDVGSAGLKRSPAVHVKRDSVSRPRRGSVQQDQNQQHRPGPRLSRGNVTTEDIDVYERRPKTPTDSTIASTPRPPRPKSETKPVLPSPLKNVVSLASASTGNEGGKENRGQSPPPPRKKGGHTEEVRWPFQNVRDEDVLTSRDIHRPNAPYSTTEGTSSTHSRSRGAHVPSPLRKSVADPVPPRPTSATEKGRTSQKELGRPAPVRSEDGTTTAHKSDRRKASMTGGPPNNIERPRTPHPNVGVLDPSSSWSPRSTTSPTSTSNIGGRPSERPRKRSPHPRRDLRPRTEVSPTQRSTFSTLAGSKKTVSTRDNRFAEDLNKARPKKATSNASGSASGRTTPDSRSSSSDEGGRSRWASVGKRRVAELEFQESRKGRRLFGQEAPTENPSKRNSGSDYFRERDARERALLNSSDFWKVV